MPKIIEILRRVFIPKYSKDMSKISQDIIPQYRPLSGNLPQKFWFPFPYNQRQQDSWSATNNCLLYLKQLMMVSQTQETQTLSHCKHFSKHDFSHLLVSLFLGKSCRRNPFTSKGYTSPQGHQMVVHQTKIILKKRKTPAWKAVELCSFQVFGWLVWCLIGVLGLFFFFSFFLQSTR